LQCCLSLIDEVLVEGSEDCKIDLETVIARQDRAFYYFKVDNVLRFIVVGAATALVEMNLIEFFPFLNDLCPALIRPVPQLHVLIFELRVTQDP
jgi:hypothetical protein